MAISKIDILEFLSLSSNLPVLDVRSPGEYLHAHFPDAHSLPLFDDEERKIIGTLYKQQGREDAIKKGLEFFAPKMRRTVETVEDICTQHNQQNNQEKKAVLIHCWRGGMRSGAVAWLLDLYGFKVYQLVGGYKAFRKWVLNKFTDQYSFRILGGYTGSSKTLVLSTLQRTGHPVIDLEGLANHKGSAFGALGENSQPGQEMFENLLALELYKNFSTKKSITDNENFCWVEDESQRIGGVIIPQLIWEQMRRSPVYFLDIDFEKRLDYLVENYGKYDTAQLMNSILRIKKRLGGLEAKNAIGFLVENNIRESFRILLNYYDKLYSKGLHNRENLASLLTRLTYPELDVPKICNELINLKPAAVWR